MPLEYCHLVNVRSHHDTEITIPPAACIIGHVGAGKSAIMESFLITAYGEAFCPDLVETVRLENGRPCEHARHVWIFRTLDGARYRMDLSITVKPAGENTWSASSHLQFQIELADGTWEPRTGKRLSETRARIAEAIGCDYDTLTSSYVSPQKLSSKFTVPPKIWVATGGGRGQYYEGPRARILLLAQAEGQEDWEQRRVAAMRAANKAELEASTLESSVAAAGQELLKRDARQVSLEAYERIARRLETESLVTQGMIDRAMESVATTEAQLREARAQLAGGAEDQRLLDSRLQTEGLKARRLSAHRTLLTRRVTIEAATARVAILEARLTTHRQDLAAIAATIRGIADQVATAAARATETEQQAAGAQDRLEASRARVRTRPILEERVGRLVALRTARESRQQQLGEQRPALATLTARIQGLLDQQATAASARVQILQRSIEASGRLQAAETQVGEREDLAKKVATLQAARETRNALQLQIRDIDTRLAAKRAQRDALIDANGIVATHRTEIQVETRRVQSDQAAITPQIEGYERRRAVMDIVPCIGVADLPRRCPLLTDARESEAPLLILKLKRNDLAAYVEPPLPELVPIEPLVTEINRLEREKADALEAHAGIERNITLFASAELQLASLETVSETLPRLREEDAQAAAAVIAAEAEAAGVNALLAELTASKDDLQSRVGTLEAEESAAATEIATLGNAEADLVALNGLEATLGALEADAEACATASTETARSLANLQDAHQAETRRQTILKAEVLGLEGSLDNMRPDSALAPELAIADREVPGLEADLAVLGPEIATLRTRVAGLEAKRVWVATAEAQVATAQTDLVRWRAELVDARTQISAALQEAATLRAEIKRLEILEIEIEANRKEAGRIRTQQGYLSVLALAYKQIPIMVLERRAIPEIEEHANWALMRMSANGMRTELKTLREVKSRDELADGLDIVITDLVGKRSYQSFSGGQSWQVDLAYRIAQARRQARKARGGLGLLMIDEGMGSQDGESLEGVIALLQELQHEFPQLLLITHIEQMKDCLPVQIRVSGGPVKSVVEMVTA